MFLAFGTVQTEETKTFINSKGFIIALMKSKSLHLQSNKSKKSRKKNSNNNKKKILLFYVLYLFLGNVSDIVPLVAGWRETKVKCTFGLFGGRKTAVSDFSFWTISKWISLLLQMFRLVLSRGTRLATSAVSEITGQPVGVGRGRGSVHWVPLCCGPLGVKR